MAGYKNMVATMPKYLLSYVATTLKVNAAVSIVLLRK
jgi:hypothetical protein